MSFHARESGSFAGQTSTLARRVAWESRRTGLSPWQYRRHLLRGALYRARGLRERLYLRVTSYFVAREAARQLRG